MSISTTSFSVNGITYHTAAKPIVVICMDGSADEYYNAALAQDKIPNLKKNDRAGLSRFGSRCIAIFHQRK